MSDLILQWLNDEVQLSRKILDFEADFENGYLIGELLHKYNQQLNFSDFRDETNRDVKIQNFKLIFPTLKSLKVSFDSKVCEKIIAKQKDVAKNILYQIKMALEKVHNPADKLLLGTKATGIQSINPQKKIKVRKDQYEKMEGDFFTDMLNKGQRSQMLINQEKHLEKFQRFKEHQDVLIEECKRKEREEEQKVKEEIRKIQLDKLQRNQNFMEDWKKKGLENWRVNRRKQKDREEEEREFKEEELNTRREKTLLQQNMQRKEILEGLDEFEGKLQQSQQQQMQLTGSRYQQSIASNNEMTATQTLNKLKEQKLLSEFQKKERDKRRRKMIVDQARNQKQFEVRQREQQILNKLNRRSRQEQELQYEEWRCLQSYDLIEKSRELREEKYKQRKELIQLNCKYKEEELLGQYQEEFDYQMDQYAKKQKELEIREKQSHRKDHYEECAEVLEYILGIQESLYWHMQDNDENQIEGTPAYEQAVQLFLQGLPQVERINRGDDIAQKQSKQAQALSQVQQDSYERHLKDGFNKVDLAAIPQALQGVEYQYKLSEIEQELRNEHAMHSALQEKQARFKENDLSQLEHQKQLVEVTMEMEQEHQQWQDSVQMPVLLSLIGKDQSGKEEYAASLSKQHGYQLVTLESILNTLMTTPPDENILHQRVRHSLEGGQSISDEDLVELVANEVTSKRSTVQGFVLLDFPQNRAQWEALQQYQPKKEEPQEEKKECLDTIQSRPSQPEVAHLQIPFIDLVVHVVRQDKECLQKQFGRLKDVRNNTTYHLTDNRPVTDNYPMMEHLSKLEEVKDAEGVLINRLVGFTQQLAPLQACLQAYGYEQYQQYSVYQEVYDLEGVEHQLEKILAIRKTKEEQEQSQREKVKQQREEEIQHISKSIEDNKKFVLTEGEVLGEQLTQYQQQRSSLPIESVKQMLTLLEQTDGHYKQGIQEGLVKTELQKKYVSQHLAELQRRFLEQLQKEDQKIVKVIQYQKEYNAFIDSNPDMIAEELTKEEMHMRVGDLEQDLWEIADDKKTFMSAQKQSIQEEQFMEKQQEAYLNILAAMVMQEHSRHQSTSLVISDYYQLVQGKEVTEHHLENMKNINMALVNDQPIHDQEAEYTWPRLQKLFEEAAKKYSAEEEEALKAEADKKAKGKKDPKKEKKGEVVATQETEGGSEMDKEKEVVLEVEQQIYKARLAALKQLGQQTLEAMKQQNSGVMNKLEDWVEYCFSVESAMIDKLGLIFRDSIEEEKKIQNEVRVEAFQVITSTMTLNFLTQPPTVHPAREKPREWRFTVSQLYLFIEDIKQMAYDSQYIDNNHLLAYLLNKTNPLNTPDLPAAFSSLDQQQVMKLISNLDRQSSGSVNIQHLCVYFALLDSPIVKLDEYLQYEQLLTAASEDKLTLEQDQFTQIAAFFDPYEEEAHETESKQINTLILDQRPFQRQKLIKELVFYLLKDPLTERVSIQAYLDILNCEGYLQDDLDKDQVSTYKNLLFN